MFCAIEQIELRVDSCPLRGCIYRGANGSCCHEQLTEQFDVRDLAQIRGIKVYKARHAVSEAKELITIGTTVLQYSEYIKKSFPLGRQTVNKERETSHIEQVLQRLYSLSTQQQEKFWDTTRFSEWSKRNGLALTLDKVREVLTSVKL